MSIETNQEQIAIKDDLTGLPNRAGLMQELEADSINEAGNFALVFIDVDGLKHTNDTLGHKAGDQLILETSQILSSGLRTDQDQANYPRESDSVRRDVFRMGGDEFVLKLSNVRTQEDVNNVIERLQQKLVNEGSNGGIKASMGGRPHKVGESGASLLDDVDKRMYDQKQARKAYQKAYLDHKLNQDDLKQYKQNLLSIKPTQYWAHLGGVLIKRATDKYSGVKGRD